MTDPRILLSEGGIADLDGVMSVMDASFDPCYGEAWTAPQCASLMPLPGVWLSLARMNEELVGFAMAREVAREAELLLLAVKSKDQKRGVGQALLQRFIAVARKRGAERLHLEVRDGNGAAKLYERSGFIMVGRRKNYYSGRDGQIYDALTLARSA
jgi:ribosomal-protein-alanine N-acetyltransferase